MDINKHPHGNGDVTGVWARCVPDREGVWWPLGLVEIRKIIPHCQNGPQPAARFGDRLSYRKRPCPRSCLQWWPVHSN